MDSHDFLFQKKRDKKYVEHTGIVVFYRIYTLAILTTIKRIKRHIWDPEQRMGQMPKSACRDAIGVSNLISTSGFRCWQSHLNKRIGVLAIASQQAVFGVGNRIPISRFVCWQSHLYKRIWVLAIASQ